MSGWVMKILKINICWWKMMKIYFIMMRRCGMLEVVIEIKLKICCEGSEMVFFLFGRVVNRVVMFVL